MMFNALENSVRSAAKPVGLLQGVVGALPLRKPTLAECLAGAGALSAGYVTFRVGCSLAVVVKAKVNRLRVWWRGPLRLRPADGAATCGESVIPESAIPGSEERAMTFPKGQCLAGFRVNGSFHVAGCAVRMDEWLVIPDHVKSAVGQQPIELLTFDQKRSIVLTPGEMEELNILDTDLLEVRLGPARFSELGLAKVNVAPCLSEDHGGYVSIVGAFGRGTTGTLRHSLLFGKVNYSSSTFKGYSGAAYMLGSQIVGIHLHGGSSNSGYSASYVLAMLKHRYKIKDEDSTDWLQGQKEAGARVEVDPEWRDLDEARVRVNGRYHIVQTDTMARVYGKTWRGGLSNKKAFRVGFVDPESAILSGEAPKTASGASSSAVTSAPSADASGIPLTEHELATLIGASRKLLRMQSSRVAET